MKKRIIGIQRDESYFRAEYDVPENIEECIRMLKNDPDTYFRCFIRGLHLIFQDKATKSYEYFDENIYNDLRKKDVPPEIARKAAMVEKTPKLISKDEYEKIKSASRYFIKSSEIRKTIKKAVKKTAKKKKASKK